MTSVIAHGRVGTWLATTLCTALSVFACGGDDRGQDQIAAGGGGATDARDAGKQDLDSGKPGQSGGGGDSASEGARDAGSSGASGGGAGGATQAGGSGGTTHTGGAGGTTGTPSDAGSETDVSSRATGLRVALGLFMREHVVLVAKSSGAALGGRPDEFNAYYAQLVNNGLLIGDYLGTIGDDATSGFDVLWSSHDLAFVDYTKAIVARDDAKKDAALSVLDDYAPKFAALLHDMLSLSAELSQTLTHEHIATTRAIIDAQAVPNWADARSKQRDAAKQAQSLADAVSGGISGTRPSVFGGDSSSKAAELRMQLNAALQEHSYLATAFAAAAIGDIAFDDDAGAPKSVARTAERAAAQDALHVNISALAALFATYQGADFAKSLASVWQTYDGALRDYASAVTRASARDKAAALEVLDERFVPELAKLLQKATDLPLDVLEALAKVCVVDLTAVIDVQAQADADQAALRDVAAAQHMQKLADTVAIALVTKQPDKF